ncbi:Uncharacterised protein [Mycobacteroides abscessus subsp. abscessus]|nr:Uncharacterised protein [Mycobacteroides abscessus subsp. abscessus]
MLPQSTWLVSTTLVWGSFSSSGASNRVSGAMPFSSAAAAVTILKVEPGG